MTTEERVMSLFERANPVPDPGSRTPTTNASSYLETLERKSSTMTMSDIQPEPTGAPPRRVWLGIAGAAASLLILVGGLVVANRSDDDPAPVDEPTPTQPADIPTTETTPVTEVPTSEAAPVTEVASTVESTTTTVPFVVPTGVPSVAEWREGAGLFVVGDTSSLIDLERTISTPQVLQATNQTGSSDAFTVRTLDADQEVVEVIVEADGARSGSYLINLDGQDFEYLAVTADGDWSINYMLEPAANFELWDGSEPLASAGPAVIQYFGEATTATFSTTRDESFVISSYSAETGLTALAEQVGPADLALDLPAGPVTIVVEASGNWTFSPESI